MTICRQTYVKWYSKIRITNLFTVSTWNESQSSSIIRKSKVHLLSQHGKHLKSYLPALYAVLQTHTHTLPHKNTYGNINRMHFISTRMSNTVHRFPNKYPKIRLPPTRRWVRMTKANPVYIETSSNTLPHYSNSRYPYISLWHLLPVDALQNVPLPFVPNEIKFIQHFRGVVYDGHAKVNR